MFDFGNCFMSFGREHQNEMFKNVWLLENKQEQDSFLMSCAHRRELKQIKAVPITKSRKFSWKYNLTSKINPVQTVCKQFLISVFQIDENRMKSVLKFCQR